MGEMRFMLDNPLIITDGWAEREQEKAKFLGALLKASERINREDKEAAESLKKLLQGVPKGKRLRGWNLRYNPDTGELIERTPWFD
ncbi:MAG: hypothetical protein ABFC65_02845 [Rectinema sp.]|jgi:ABC-type nitrate/sulfonate/bicarbonate transport system substrate-binding protein